MHDYALGEGDDDHLPFIKSRTFPNCSWRICSSRNSRIEEDLIDQLFNSSEKRLRGLLVLANFGKEGRPEPIVGKISQETMAEMIGTTRSRVSFFMNKFRKLGFIDYNGKLEIHNSLLSVVLYDKPAIKSQDASEEPALRG